jgi:hypothetical protein
MPKKETAELKIGASIMPHVFILQFECNWHTSSTTAIHTQNLVLLIFEELIKSYDELQHPKSLKASLR